MDGLDGLRVQGKEARMSDERESLRRQLAEAEENLLLIEERKAEYVLGVEVPLTLVKEERRLKARIAELRAELGKLIEQSKPKYTDIAYTILSESDRPLTAEQIVERGVAGGLLDPKAQWQYMRQQLNSEIRRSTKTSLPRRFEKLDRGYAIPGRTSSRQARDLTPAQPEPRPVKPDPKNTLPEPGDGDDVERPVRRFPWKKVIAIIIPIITVLGALAEILGVPVTLRQLMPGHPFPVTIEPVQTDTLVVITKFWGDGSIPAHQYIAEALGSEIDDLELNNSVSRRTVDYVVDNQDEAIKLGRHLKADILIWGRYSPDEITTRVELLNRGKGSWLAGGNTALLSQFNSTLELFAQPSSYSIGLCRTKDLPAQTSYFSILSLGILEFQEGRLSRALSLLERAAQITFEQCALAKDDVYRWQGLVNFSVSRPEEAIDRFTEAIRIDPADFGSLMGRASANLLAGRAEAMRLDIDRAVELSSHDVKVLAFRATALALAGAKDEALEAASTLTPLNDPLVIYAKTYVFLLAGRLDDANAAAKPMNKVSVQDFPPKAFLMALVGLSNCDKGRAFDEMLGTGGAFGALLGVNENSNPATVQTSSKKALEGMKLLRSQSEDEFLGAVLSYAEAALSLGLGDTQGTIGAATAVVNSGFLTEFGYGLRGIAELADWKVGEAAKDLDASLATGLYQDTLASLGVYEARAKVCIVSGPTPAYDEAKQMLTDAIRLIENPSPPVAFANDMAQRCDGVNPNLRLAAIYYHRCEVGQEEAAVREKGKASDSDCRTAAQLLGIPYTSFQRKSIEGHSVYQLGMDIQFVGVVEPTGPQIGPYASPVVPTPTVMSP